MPSGIETTGVGRSERVSSEERFAIVQTVLDYVEGWFDGDPVRMERALHADLAKRGVAPEDLRSTVIHPATKPEMVEATSSGVGRGRDVPDRRLEVEVLDVYGQIATAMFRSAVYREYLHLVRTTSGWKILNALYRRT